MSESQPGNPGYSVEITPRDVRILRGLFECRVMTVKHVAELYFEGRMDAASKRLWKLKSASLVMERPRRVYEPSILFLSRSGLKWLLENAQLADYPKLSLSALNKRARVSLLTIGHELAVMDARAAFEKAINATPGLKLMEFSTWPLLFQFTVNAPGHSVLVKPDGFLRIHDGDVQSSFYLEVDRSSETQEVLIQRISHYLRHYRSGGFAIHQGAPIAQFKKFPFRVLIVLQNTERRNNVAGRLLVNQPPILSMAVLTTMVELQNDPLGPIWIRPVDYRQAVDGSAYEPRPVTGRSYYKRQIERERLVERIIKKFRLLNGFNLAIRAPTDNNSTFHSGAL